jgi:phosphohistidine phosphatase
MKRLILLRHAKTEAWNEGVSDTDRRLLDRGHDDARNIAAELHRAGWIADCALVSTARRTRETWRHLHDLMPDCSVSMTDELYLAGVPALEGLVGLAAGDASTVLVIGHNPGLHDFALTILRQAGSHDHQVAKRLWEKLPTGSAILFEADDDGAFVPVHFKLSRFIRPKDIRSQYE